jgi:hypothetical protein
MVEIPPGHRRKGVDGFRIELSLSNSIGSQHLTDFFYLFHVRTVSEAEKGSEDQYNYEDDQNDDFQH